MKLTAAFCQISATGDRHLWESLHSKKERKICDKPCWKCIRRQYICHERSCYFVLLRAALSGGLQMTQLTEVSLGTSREFWKASRMGPWVETTTLSIIEKIQSRAMQTAEKGPRKRFSCRPAGTLSAIWNTLGHSRHLHGAGRQQGTDGRSMPLLEVEHHYTSSSNASPKSHSFCTTFALTRLENTAPINLLPAGQGRQSPCKSEANRGRPTVQEHTRGKSSFCEAGSSMDTRAFSPSHVS